MFFKFLGVGLILTGIWLIIFFPFLDKYQPEEMAKSSALIGLILLGIGIYLLIS